MTRQETAKSAVKLLYTVLEQDINAVAKIANAHAQVLEGNDLPPINEEVIVLCNNGKVCFGHRPNTEGYVVVGGEKLYTKTYGKGGWNIPDVRWWLDVSIPNLEE